MKTAVAKGKRGGGGKVTLKETNNVISQVKSVSSFASLLKHCERALCRGNLITDWLLEDMKKI